MPDKPKSVREQVREAKTRVCKDFERREVARKAKLLVAFSEYFADKWQEEIDLAQRDAVAKLVTSEQGGIYIFLNREAKDEPGYDLKHNAGALALERLRERGFKVELDAASRYPDVYKVWKE